MQDHEQNFELNSLPPSIYPYVKLASDRVIFFSEDFTKNSAYKMSSLLLYYDFISEEEITIYINSDGGEISALANIYDVMQMIKSPIRTVVLGRAYSAGAVMLAAGTKGLRGAFENSCIMIHGIQCAFPNLHSSDSQNSKNYLEFLEKNNDNIIKILAEHTGKPLEEIRSDCLRDRFLTAPEALKYGIIDYII